MIIHSRHQNSQRVGRIARNEARARSQLLRFRPESSRHVDDDLIRAVRKHQPRLPECRPRKELALDVKIDGRLFREEDGDGRLGSERLHATAGALHLGVGLQKVRHEQREEAAAAVDLVVGHRLVRQAADAAPVDAGDGVVDVEQVRRAETAAERGDRGVVRG